MTNESIESLLNKLPSYIKMYDKDIEVEFEDEHYIYYLFGLDKDSDDGTIYELSYFCYLWEKELVSFKGSLREVAEKAVAWCKENGYINS